VIEGAQGRYIKNTAGSAGNPACQQAIEGPEEGGQGFSRAGGSHHEHVLSRGDGRPGLLLGVGGLPDLTLEPRLNDGMKRGKGHGRTWGWDTPVLGKRQQLSSSNM